MDTLTLRFLERTACVLIGGMAIYLGYRLFLNIPEAQTGSGNFALPWDISIAITRVGPGVFFALFGTSAVCLSLIRPLQIPVGTSELSTTEVDSASRSYSYAGELPKRNREARAAARARLGREMATLNSLPQMLNPNLPDYDRRDVDRSLRRVKLALLDAVWGEKEEGFGELSAFREWVNSGEVGDPPDGMNGALDLYRYGAPQ